jgi:two-component system sensor histidine kinase CpxA
MRPTSSLLAKILCWFFLNLIVVVAILAIFFVFQPYVNVNAILGQQGSNRLRTAGVLITHDLKGVPRADWPEVLARHAKAHQVDLTLALEDGSRFSTMEGGLPEKVRRRISGFSRRKPLPGRLPRAPFFEDPPRGPGNPLIEDEFLKKRHIRRSFSGKEGRNGKKPYFMLRTGDPTRYWIGVRIPFTLGPERLPGRALLLASSDSITGKGFFFDPLPWILIGATVIVLSVLLWIPMVRNITRPLARMTYAAEEIARGRFDVPLHETRADEIGRLARAVRHMTSRLSAFVRGQRRFLGDVSHELGSPIARIQFGLGALEQRVEKENVERVRDIMEDVDHMSTLVSELLAFSRADLKSETTKLESIALLPIVETVVKREGTPGERIVIGIDPMVRVIGSAELLTRALANLLRNAVKYAGDQGPIHMSAQKRGDMIDIEVRDNGAGVPEDLLDQLFEPFFRPEPSRDRDSGGVGLGLAIVKTCVEACKGAVSAANLTPHGFAVTMSLKAG